MIYIIKNVCIVYLNRMLLEGKGPIVANHVEAFMLLQKVILISNPLELL